MDIIALLGCEALHYKHQYVFEQNVIVMKPAQATAVSIERLRRFCGTETGPAIPSL